MDSNVGLALIAVIAYLVGAIPTAYFVTKGMVGKDIRLEGSGNVGAMNAYSLIKTNRSARLAALALVGIMLADMGKGVLAIYAARWLDFLGYSPALALILASFFVILGHNYPFCFRFRKGGTGFATFIGSLLALTPYALGIWGSTMLFTIFLAEYISHGKWHMKSLSKAISIIGIQIPGRLIGLGASLIPIYFFDPRLLFPVLGPTVLVFIKHRERIRTLLRELKE